MDQPSNSERFDTLALEAFALLYVSFPLPRDLDPMDFSVPREEHDGILQEDCNFVFAVVSWLEAEGYLRSHSSTLDGVHHRVVLSEKGLRVLRAIPSALETKEPLGEQMRSAVAGGAKSLAKKLIDQAIDLGVRGVFQQYGI